MSKRKPKSIWYLDLPCPDGIGDEQTDRWTLISTFKSKRKAVEFIREHIGNCDDDGNICLITEGQDQ